MKQATLERIVSSPRLPSLPAVAVQVLEFTRSDSVDLREAARVIQNDQALTTKVLRTVNSSYYGLSRPCATIKQALVYLGANTVRTLVLGFALVDTMGPGDEDEAQFDFIDYWRRDLYTAVAARELAGLHAQCDADEAFLGGLMQDIGMVAMHRVLNHEYLQAVRQTNGDHRKLPKIERDSFEIDHPRVGAEVASRWKFPEQFINTIRYHHDSQNAPSEVKNIVRTVELANQVALMLTKKDSDGPQRILVRDAAEWFDIPARPLQELLNTVVRAVDELASLFRVDVGELPLEDMMCEAEERLVQIQHELESENQQLRENNQSLSEQNISDALTGVANRKYFDEQLRTHFRDAYDNDRSLAIVFCDIDHFKPVNDTHGHQAGDHMLIEVARRLREYVGDRGLVARYGGEEFAIILPNTDRITAAEIAEEVRLKLSAEPVNLEGTSQHAEQLTLTMSMGVAAYEPELKPFMTHPHLLLKVADHGVYAAKKAGRNCVRVYTNRRVHTKDAA